MIIRWFLSRTVRQAAELKKHVLKLMNAQRDLLSESALQDIGQSAAALDQALRSGADKPALQQKMADLETSANNHLKPYPNAVVRENIEVLLVAVAVAMGIRTFFLQPMKIPTGSMQPTLYGITYQDLKDRPQEQIPGWLGKWVEWIFHGTSYYHIVAREEGTFHLLDSAPQRVLPFVTKQRFAVGDAIYTIWSPDDNFFRKSGITPGQHFQKGEEIMKMKVTSGDHLFVNRLTYNFRHPRRGEIVIFETRGIQDLPQDTYYIKRLVALGREKVRIGNDQHLIINGQRLDAATPPFENLYTFSPNYKEDHYFGHANELVGNRMNRYGIIAPLFKDETVEYEVPPDRYLVMGDNTMNSYDSRYWGDLPQQNVIGKAGFVYWPISKRFGWGYR